MNAETFTRDEFQAALPENAVPLGLVDEELCWLIPVTDTAGIVVGLGISAKDTQIVAEATLYQAICESIVFSSAPTGYAWLYRLQSDVRGVSVQLTSGWQRRLQDSVTQLRGLMEVAGNCSVCGKPYKLFRSTKPGPNRGRWYATCKKDDQFYWLG